MANLKTFYIDTESMDVADPSLYYTKVEIDQIIDDLEFGIMKVVDTLPVTGEEHVIYLVPKPSPATGFNEYIWIADESSYELIGDTSIDLTDYYTKTQTDALLDDKVDKEAGKGLSTNDYTTAEKNKLAGITWTKKGILNLLNYEEIEIAIEDTDGEVTSRKVLAERPPETFRTVLYPDGYFIINESSYDRKDNETAHGTAAHSYPAYDPTTNPYDFATSGSQPWYEQRRDIFTIEIGAPLKPTSVARWFGDLYFLTAIDLTNLDTSDCTNFSRMFSSANRLPSVDVSGLDVSKATTMQMMFNANNVMRTIDISAWNTPALVNTNQMFNGCGGLVTIKASANFNVSGVTNSGNMFNGCSNLVGGQGTVYDSSVVDKTRAKIDGGTSDPGYFTA